MINRTKKLSMEKRNEYISLNFNGKNHRELSEYLKIEIGLVYKAVKKLGISKRHKKNKIVRNFEGDGYSNK